MHDCILNVYYSGKLAVTSTKLLGAYLRSTVSGCGSISVGVLNRLAGADNLHLLLILTERYQTCHG
jgi:hypothetical protein